MAADSPALHHYGLVVPNLSQAVEFYTRVFGYTVVKNGGWKSDNTTFNRMLNLVESAANVAVLQLDNSYLEIFEFDEVSSTSASAPPNALGLRHMAYQVKNPSATLKKLIAAGGSQLGELTSVKNGATAVYCRDPFGNIIELIKPGGALPPLPNKATA